MTPPEYVNARSVLLDALDALGPHRDAAVPVGAQAVYRHSGSADLATAPTTTDADPAPAPHRLADEPLIGAAVADAGFIPGPNPGTWLGRWSVAVDLVVPDALSGEGGGRGARIPVHGNKVARRTPGLEAAIVDDEIRLISALDDDPRSFPVRVAGPAALLVSEVVKIAERRATPQRPKPKDGLDVLRLLRTADLGHLAATLRELEADVPAGEVVGAALAHLPALGTAPNHLLPSLAAAAEQGFEDPDVIRMSVVALVEDLPGELREG